MRQAHASMDMQGYCVGDTPLVPLQELQNSQHNVIDIAETGGLCFLGMMGPSCPIDSNVCIVLVHYGSSIHRASSVDLRDKANIRSEKQNWQTTGFERPSRTVIS